MDEPEDSDDMTSGQFTLISIGTESALYTASQESPLQFASRYANAGAYVMDRRVGNNVILLARNNLNYNSRRANL